MTLGTALQQILAGSAAIGGRVVGVEGVVEALGALDVFVGAVAFRVVGGSHRPVSGVH